MDTSLTPGVVLVGVDGSAHSDVALAWAAAYAEDQARPLAIVHASAFLAGIVHDRGGGSASVAEGQAVVQAARDRALSVHPDVAVSERVVAGDPREVLAEMAADASVLVLGSRGLGTVASLLLGSVSVALAGHSPCPVVVVRPHPVSVPDGDLSVVVGVHGTPDDAEALTLAFELATAQHRPLVVLHALGDTPVYPFPDVLDPGLVHEAHQDWELLAETLGGYAEKFPDVVVHRRLVQSSAARALVDASGRAAMVVLGSRSHGATLRHRIAPVSRSVVEHASCTVAVVRGAP